jgi:hypothetical protein
MENVTPLRARNDLDEATSKCQSCTSSAELVTGGSLERSKSCALDDPPPRMHLTTPKHNFQLLASRTVSQAISEEARACKLPASPLDSISPSLYPRFPRFSITTESSHPDLSTDEVTSTRISLDEEGIVATPRSSDTSKIGSSKRQKLQITLQRAVSSPTLSLRRISERIKRAPGNLLPSRMSKMQTPRVCESEAEV